MICSLIIVASVLLVIGDPRQDNAPPSAAARPTTDVLGQLRAEVARLQSGHASSFFSGLIEASQSADRAGLSGPVPEMLKREGRESRDALQVPALIENADRVTRVILRFWLSRALASDQRPPTLREWEEHRARIVGHGEAIILEAVLRPGQAQRWRARASRPHMPPLPGRYSTIPVDYADGHKPAAYTRSEYQNVIHQLQYESRASDLLDILLDPSSKRLLELSPEQSELLERVDLLARNVKRYWWVRGVEPTPRPDPEGIGELPPTPAMEEKLSLRGRRLRASIVAHAEEMALEGILTPAQAEGAKLELWRRRGLHALLDPELASRLRLSSTQRAELAERLTERVEEYHNTVRTGYPLGGGKIPLKVLEQAQQQWRQELAQKVANYDQQIWEILNHSQLRALARLLNKRVAGYDPPKPKAKAKRGGQEE